MVEPSNLVERGEDRLLLMGFSKWRLFVEGALSIFAILPSKKNNNVQGFYRNWNPKEQAARVLQPCCGLHLRTTPTPDLSQVQQWSTSIPASLKRRGRLMRNVNSPFILKLSGIPSCWDKREERETRAVINCESEASAIWHKKLFPYGWKSQILGLVQNWCFTDHLFTLIRWMK